jgi:predicted ATPase/transcriptional regulator with XRE-family HTH domain
MGTFSFGEWVSRRRKGLDLTQRELAARAGCATATLKKIEADERRPSRELAGLLAVALQVPAGWRETFVECARGFRPVDALSSLAAEEAAAQDLGHSPAALPVFATPFIGRATERVQIARLLAQPDCRLLTLIGPGGIGKTRLMLQAATDVVDTFADGAWLVELAALTAPGPLAERVAAALRVREQPGRAAIDTLVDYLRQKVSLLLLDNVEHLVEACARLAEHLLRYCPRLKLMATGRESLSIDGERIFQVPSLGLPQSELAPEAVLASEAVQLFLARAPAARPSFELTVGNAPAIAQIARRLDGIPLALELAAARLRTLSPEQIAARLDDRFRLLTGGRRTALPRQQTLQALIDWSWNLLDETERVLFRRLAVFSGGWTLEAAERVVSGQMKAEREGLVTATDNAPLPADQVLDLLEHLTKKSLVVVDHLVDGDIRYGVLETIRQYARDRLVEAGEGEALRSRHAAYFLALAEATEPHLRGPEMLLWRGRVNREIENMRAVLEWAVESRPDIGLRLASTMFIERDYDMPPSEARRWLEIVIAKAGERISGAGAASSDPVALAKALTAMAVYANGQGETVSARVAAEEAVALARQAGAKRELVHALYMLALSLYFLNNVAAAFALGQEAIALCRQHGFDYELGSLLSALAVGLALQGNMEGAEACLEEAGPIVQRIGNLQLLAGLHSAVAGLAYTRGDYGEAAGEYFQAATLLEFTGDRLAVVAMRDYGEALWRAGKTESALVVFRNVIRRWHEWGNQASVAHIMEKFAYLAMQHDEMYRAAKLIGAAQVLRAAVQVEITNPPERLAYEQALAQLRAVLGPSQFDAAQAEGYALELDAAVAFALGPEA